MTDETKNLWDIVISSTQLAVVLGGVIWAIYRFRAERPHHPRIEFDVNADFLGPQKNYFVTQIIINAHNKGLRVRKFPSIDVLVRGIPEDAKIEEWTKHKPRLLIPDKVIDHAEVVFQENYGHLFVEPGVNQEITYFARIPSRYRFVSIRAEFRYDDERTHSAERLFDTFRNKRAEQDAADQLPARGDS